MKRIVTFLLAVVMCIGVAIPVYAEDAACPGAGELHTLKTCTDWTEISKKDAVCGEQGYTLYQCNVCDDYFADNWTAAQKAHTFGEPVVTPATCTEDGKSVKTCADCGYESVTVIAHQGHKFGEWVTNGVTCGPTGVTQTRECSVCGAKEENTVASTDHNWVILDDTLKLPTACGEKGSVKYQCTICKTEKTVDVLPLYADHNFELVEIVSGKEPVACKPGVGLFKCKNCGKTEEREVVDPSTMGAHKFETKIEAVAPTCTTAGSTEGYKCSVCGTVDPARTPATVAALGHDYSVNRVEPTCTTDGSETKTCTRCGDTSTTTIPSSVAHVWKTTTKEATCTEFGGTLVFCEICGTMDSEKTKTYINPHKYVETVVDATCTATGTKTFVCSVCSDTYVEVIPAKGHNYVETVVANTCTTEGYTHDVCSVCGDAVNKRDVVAAAHKLTAVTVAPTCVDKGYTYDKCSACTYESAKRDFVDALGEVAAAHTDTSKLILISYIIDPTCTSTGTSRMYCPFCNYITDEAVAPKLAHKFTVFVKTVAPTCTEKGYDVYKCADCDATENRNETAATGHSYVATVIAPTCLTMKGWTEHKCSTCGDTYTDTEVTITMEDLEKDLTGKYHVGTITHTPYRDATCTLNGYDTYSCDACNHGWLVITAAATGHDYKVTAPAEAATCTKEGKTAEETCSVCGDVKAATTVAKLAHTPGAAATCTTAQTCTVCSTVLVEALGHTAVVDAAVAPTCTDTGLTEGKHCSVCNAVLTAQTVVAAKGHTPGAAATCTSNQVCTVCNVELAAKLPHTHVVKDSRSATCDLFGYNHYVCVCGDEYVTDYNKELGHDYKETTRVEAGCEDDGYVLYVCTHDATHNYKDTLAATGHKNAAGETLTTTCTETIEDRICDNCGAEIKLAHNYVTTKVDATCNTVNYTLHVCTVCQESYTDGYGVEFGDHNYSNWVETKPATITSKGSKEKVCAHCGDKVVEEIPCLEGIHVSYDIANGVSDKDDMIVNSGLIALTVKLTAENVDVWGIRLRLEYNDFVEFESYELLTDAFGEDAIVNAKDGVVTVLVNVPNTDDNKKDSYLVNGEMEFVTLYFRVAADAAFETVEFDTDSCEVTQADASTLVVEADEIDDVKVGMLADVNGDGVIDLVDASIIAGIITGEEAIEYSSEADIDKNGEVEVADFAAIQKYLVDITTYEEMALNGVPA